MTKLRYHQVKVATLFVALEKGLKYIGELQERKNRRGNLSGIYMNLGWVSTIHNILYKTP